jgi:hypothetical protein
MATATTTQTPDPIAQILEQARSGHQEHASPDHPQSGTCISGCPGPWPCIPGRLADAIQQVWNHLRRDGIYLELDTYVPVRGFHEAVVDTLTASAGCRPELVPAGAAPGYLQTFSEFWARLLLRADGTLDFAATARELSDYHDMIGWASEVYSDVTGGRISKPNTHPSAVIAVASEHADEVAGWAIDDLIDEIEAQDRGPASATEVVAQIREITGRAPGGGLPSYPAPVRAGLCRSWLARLRRAAAWRPGDRAS